MATSRLPIDSDPVPYEIRPARIPDQTGRMGRKTRDCLLPVPQCPTSLSHLWRGSGRARYYLASKFFLWAVVLAAGHSLSPWPVAAAQTQSPQAARPRGEAYEKCKSFFSGPANDLADSEENNAFLNSCGWKFYDYHELADAGKAFTQASAMAQRRSDRPELTDALDGGANVHRLGGDFSDAERLLQQALHLATELQDKDELSKVYLSLGRLDWDQGKIDEGCDDYLPRSLRLLQELDNPLRLAIVNNNLGTCFSRRGDYSGALPYFQQSVASLQKIGEELKSAVAIDNIGGCYRLLGDFSKAIETTHQALIIRKKYKDDLMIGKSFDGLGNIYVEQGNYAEALEALQKGFELRTKAGFPFDAAESLNNIAAAYEAQGEYAQATSHLRRALTIAETLKNDDLAAEVEGHLGEAYLHEGNAAQAFTILQRALENARGADDPVLVAFAQYVLGKLYLKQGRFDSARTALQQAHDFYQSKSRIVDVGDTLVELAEVERRAGHLPESLKLATSAREIGERAGSPELEWRSLTLLGHLNSSLGHRDQAAKSFENAIGIIEAERERVAGGEENRARFFAERVTPYQERIALAISSGNKDDALYYAERSKARVLLDVIGADRVPITTAMSDDERAREAKLRVALASLNSQVLIAGQTTPPDEKRLAALKHQRDDTRLQYEDFESTLYSAHPELAVGRGTVPVLRAAEAKAMLHSRSTAIVEYAVVRNRTWAFVITGGGIHLFELPSSNSLVSRQVERFRQQLARRDLNISDAARQMYQQVFGPAGELLKDKTELVIIPDGSLWDLPFQALQSAPDRYLIEDSAISYAPSLTALREMTRPRAHGHSQPALIAFGNPTISPTVARRRKLTLMGETLSPLPEAEIQAKAVAQIYSPNSRVYVGKDAREDRWRTEAPAYRIVHLATHGVLDDRSPLYSYLVLSPSDDPKNPENGLLEAWEIMRTPLNADLVVLSACETARGRVSAGEAMIGLTWAFFVAGSPATLVTQWKVESASSTSLMTEFHRRWKGGHTGLSKTRALQLAALQMLHTSKYSHPFYWAGYILVGNGQ